MAKPLKPANPALFYKGTADDPRLGDAIVSIAGPDALPRKASTGITVAMIGHADDRAVVNGRGRPGAAQGPAELRRYLSRLTPGDSGELARVSVHDLGDATPELGGIEEVQDRKSVV